MFKRLLYTNNDPVFTIIRLALGTVVPRQPEE